MIDLAIRRNILSLFLLQGGVYLIPLLTLPWLTRVLGVSEFGRMGFITAFIAYFILLVDWGFSLSATKQIAIFRNDKVARSKVFWDTLFARLLLALIGFALLVSLIFFVPQLYVNAPFLLLGYLAVLGSIIAPTFYFQGIEKMGKMSLINLLIKFLSVPCIFFFVTSDTDIAMAIGIPAGFIFLAAAVNFITLFFSNELIWVKPSCNQIMRSLKDGWPLFLSTASIGLYTNSNVVILGFVADAAAVAYFTAAQIIVRAGQAIYGPLSQALFPRMSQLFHHAKDSAIILLRKLMWVQGIISALLSCFLYISAPWLMTIIFGEQFELGESVLRWLSPLLFLIGLSNIFGIQCMVPLGYTGSFARILLASGLFNVLIMLPLGYWFGADGAAVAVLITEFFVTVLMGLYLRSVEPKLFKIRA
jgi:PST family polysaccharide transporter